MSWANHRWVRYRITIANLQRFLERFAQGYHYCMETPPDGTCPPSEPSYAEMINRAKGTPPERFFWGPRQQPIAAALTQTLVETTALWDKPHTDLDDGIMQPHSELRNVPKA